MTVWGMYLACERIKKGRLACLICLLAPGVFAGLPAVSRVAGAQGINTVPQAGTGLGEQGNIASAGQFRMIGIDDLNAFRNGNTDFLLVDARPREQYVMAHIPGAISMPLNEIPMCVGSLDKSRMIVTYCVNYHCPIGTKAAAAFASLGFANVYDYNGGLKEWQEMGYATAAGSS
jgi:rhodanese-related sulfurtransferase